MRQFKAWSYLQFVQLITLPICIKSKNIIRLDENKKFKLFDDTKRCADKN